MNSTIKFNVQGLIAIPKKNELIEIETIVDTKELINVAGIFTDDLVKKLREFMETQKQVPKWSSDSYSREAIEIVEDFLESIT